MTVWQLGFAVFFRREPKLAFIKTRQTKLRPWGAQNEARLRHFPYEYKLHFLLYSERDSPLRKQLLLVAVFVSRENPKLFYLHMESSSRPSTRFRFRDHSESEIAAFSDTDSDLSSASSEGDDGDRDLESMTGKVIMMWWWVWDRLNLKWNYCVCECGLMLLQGIKHLCSELQELKLASNDEFHKNILSNYTVFIRYICM